ncbi:MAG: tetratricopeptide repeat protein, partial [Kofleriaceae bacterium]|nr:tetratricopeptide repeat protein [Kofleriaceae bacterium]
PFVANPPAYQPPASPAANLPTMAIQPLSAAQQASAAAVDQLFGSDGPAPVWAQRTIAVQPGAAPDPRSAAAANEPTMRPSELDPSILALMAGGIPDPNMQQSGAMPIDQVSLGTPPRGAMKTGMRKRSRLAVVLWVVVGILVIGGGVFAGFQIRAIRLQKQIAAARQRATDLAKADTWGGWTAARDSLANIVGAKPTLENRAALARARAMIAYEFGDGIAEAKAAVDELAGQGGLDGSLAAAFLALAMDDAKAAKTAADAALAAAPNDPAAQYALGEIALLAGDAKTALAQMKAASDKDARPLYGVGLARAQAATYSWDEAIATLDRVLAANADHPAAVITRGEILASSGRIAADPKLANDVRAQVDRIGVEGRRPLGEQQHGVSPTQVAFAYLSLARVDTARGDLNAARRALKLATDVNLDDQRFAEEAVDVLVDLGDLATARSQIDLLIKEWPQSRGARLSLAQIYVAQGHAGDAVDLLAKAPDVIATADGLAARGAAELAAGDAANAAQDFDAALKKLPTHEPAIVGRAWLEIQTGDLDAATKRVAERYSAKGSSPALTVVYAATLRRSADPATREKAKPLLEKVVKGLPGVDVAVAQLELARIYRDSGDFSSARAAYNEAARTGSVDARIELALLSIDDQKPLVGRDMLDALLKETGDHPSPQLVLEGARARMLAGDHTGAEQLLELGDKMSSVERWKLDRERARLAFRKSQFPIAAAALTRALDTCGGDAETFLLAVDTAVAEPSLGEKVKKLAPERLKGRPELAIVNGKLLLAQEKDAEAYASFRSAKEALKAEKASLRRIAQADFGLALIAANRNNAAEARVLLELVMQEDPSIVDTYIFAADLLQGQPREVKKAFEYAQKATALNPDYAYAWLVVGKLANKLGDKRTLTDAIGRLQTIAPQGDELKELQALRGK